LWYDAAYKDVRDDDEEGHDELSNHERILIIERLELVDVIVIRAMRTKGGSEHDTHDTDDGADPVIPREEKRAE